jgi:hypothetical protein
MTELPKRAGYFLIWAQGNGSGPGDGVKKKIGEQIRNWRKLGVPTRLFILAYKECEAAWRTELEARELVVHAANRKWDRFGALERIRADIRGWAPEFVYMRQETFYPALGRVMSSVPSFVELNGDEIAEARGASLPHFLYRVASRRLLLRNASGFVAVSKGLAVSPGFRRFRLPTAVIANGIDLSTRQGLPAPESTELRFGFIGSPFGARWHGVDKIVELARTRPDWAFEIIGPEAASLERLPPNAHAHGPLGRAEYEPILARCDAAFGVLSGYEKEAEEASPLKIREYLAYGIPTINGLADTDFPDGAPFLLELPNTPDNVARSIDRIERFANEWKGKRVPRSAVEHLDSALKDRRRLEFIGRVLGGNSAVDRVA